MADVDYTQGQIPPWAFLMRQAQVVPPDAAQANAGQPGQAPPYLQANPKAAGAVENLGVEPQTAASNPLNQTQAVPQMDVGLSGYLRPNREMDKAQLAAYDRMAKEGIAGQSAGLEQIQQYIRELQGKPTEIDWTPLAAYIDSTNPGSKMMEAAKAMEPLTPEKKAQQIMQLQMKLQGERGKLTKDQLDALSQQIKMQHDNYRDDAMVQHYMNEDKTAAARVGTIGSRETMQAERMFLNDPVNKTYIPRLDGAIKIVNLIDAAQREPDKIKSNKALLGQLNAEIGRLETGSQSPALGAQEKTEMHDTAAALRDYYDTLTGNVTGVDLSAKYNQARGMISDLSKSYQDQIDARNEVIKAGATPAQQAVFDAKISAYKKGVADRIGKTSIGGGGGGKHDHLSDEELYKLWKEKMGK